MGMKSSAIALPAALWALYRHIRRLDPQIVQTWLYHGDLLGGIASRLAGVPAIAWNIRASNPQLLEKVWTKLVVRACAYLSRAVPSVVICCANSARKDHVLFGYDESKFHVVPNGFDLDLFKPDAVARLEVRSEFDIPADAPLIGLMARLEPLKNHRMFFEAAAILRRRVPDVHFVLAGEGVEWENSELSGWVDAADARRVTRLLGRRGDMPRLTAALDVAALCSTTEAFPNVLGEALACCVPCVSTDVGDAALIVGKSGRMVPSGDVPAFAAALGDVLRLSQAERLRMGNSGRARMVADFSLAAVTRSYLDVYDRLLAAYYCE